MNHIQEVEALLERLSRNITLETHNRVLVMGFQGVILALLIIAKAIENRGLGDN